MFRRTIVITGLVLVLACVSTLAQGQRRSGAPAQRIERLQRKLNLSESQMNAIRTLEQNRAKEMKSLRQELRQQGQDRSQAREKAREINQRFLSGVKELLTPEQLQGLPKRLR